MRILKGLLVSSVLLGVVFIATAWSVVPPWLRLLLLTGLVGFAAATLLAFAGKKLGYWLGTVLAAAVLIVLPARAHVSFITEGRLMETAIIIMGALLQTAYITFFFKNIILNGRKNRSGT